MVIVHEQHDRRVQIVRLTLLRFNGSNKMTFDHLEQRQITIKGGPDIINFSFRPHS